MLYSNENIENAPAFAPSEIREDISSWMERLQSGLEKGRIRFTESGNLVPYRGRGGVMASVFAMKIAWQIGIWDSWNNERKISFVNFVKQQQNQNGLFIDPWLSGQNSISWKEWVKVGLGRVKYDDLKKYYSLWHERNIRAETRQNISALLMVGAQPNYIPPVVATNYEDAYQFLDVLDWKDPWGAGSHLSHMLMLTTTHKIMGSKKVNAESIYAATFDFLRSIYHENTGTWYRGANIPVAIQINGAMKIFSGLQWLEEHPFVKNEKLLRLVLSQPFYSDGCHFTNSLFVLHQIKKLSGLGENKAKIIERAHRASKCLMLHKKKQSGFSFNHLQSQQHYYTARVSKGLKVADLHGTTMFSWACAIVIDLLSDTFPDVQNEWKVHIP